MFTNPECCRVREPNCKEMGRSAKNLHVSMRLQHFNFLSGVFKLGLGDPQVPQVEGVRGRVERKAV